MADAILKYGVVSGVFSVEEKEFLNVILFQKIVVGIHELENRRIFIAGFINSWI